MMGGEERGEKERRGKDRVLEHMYTVWGLWRLYAYGHTSTCTVNDSITVSNLRSSRVLCVLYLVTDEDDDGVESPRHESHRFEHLHGKRDEDGRRETGDGRQENEGGGRGKEEEVKRTKKEEGGREMVEERRMSKKEEGRKHC